MATSSTAKKATSKAPSGKKPVSKPAKSNAKKPALHTFFVDELKDIYWAEKHLVKALPKMKKAATSSGLVAAITDHFEVTKTHVARLEKVFELLGEKAQAKKCDAMDGLTKEADSIVEDTESGTATRDVGIILAAQKVEHYEIATYGGLTQLAKTLNLGKVADLLGQTLAEEKEADETLTGIAENDINYEASGEDE